MKAIAVFPKEKKVRLIDHPEPQIENATQVKLKILDVGVCGTDREICEFKYGTPPKGSDFLILGHESLGQVIEIGFDVKGLKIGDLAVIMVRRPCPHLYCLPCQSGQQDFCSTGDFKERGINGLHGFMTEMIVEEEKYVIKVPTHLSDIGVLTEPLTISEKALRQIEIIQKRLPWKSENQCQALVIGAGPVGLLAAHACITRGFQVAVYSLEPDTSPRALLTKALGAKYICATSSNPTQLQSQINTADVIFDGSGASKLSFEMFPLLNYNGVFVWTGIPGRKEPIDINAGTIMRDIVLKNQSIVGSVNAAHIDFQNAISNLTPLTDKLKTCNLPLIHRFPIEKFEELLLKPPAADVFKSVIHFAEMK